MTLASTPNAATSAGLAHIRHQPLTVADIAHRCASGEWGMPSLQRNVVWDPPLAAALVNSLAQNLCAGQLILWEPPQIAGHHTRGRSSAHVLAFLLDGQQRATALTALLGATEPLWCTLPDNKRAFDKIRTEVCINVFTLNAVAVKDSKREETPGLFRFVDLVSTVTDAQAAITFGKEQLEPLGLSADDAITTAVQLHSFLERVSKRTMNVDIGRWSNTDAVDQFVRTNTNMRPLSTEEVLLGHMSLAYPAVRVEVDRIVAALAARGAKDKKAFNTFLRTVLAEHARRHGIEVQSRLGDYKGAELAKHDISPALRATEKAWEYVLDYLEERGVTPHMIESYNLLNPLVGAVLKFPNQLRAKGDDRLLAIYVIGARLSRYQKHSTDAHKKDVAALAEATTADELVDLFARVLQDNQLLRNHTPFAPTSPQVFLAVNKKDIGASKSGSHLAVEYAIVCHRNGWTDPRSGQPIAKNIRAKGGKCHQWDHVYAIDAAVAACAPAPVPAWVDSLANLMRVEADTNREYGTHLPSVRYLAGDPEDPEQLAAQARAAEALSAQLFSDAPEITDLGTAEKYVQERAETLAHELDWPLRLLGLIP